ncbi:MAG: hypothetical protein A2Y10_07145 [Planctomycetes bacterium GWF2_41_51]|nr:MAG: hypothetical protein A2Y10_07145 [Planctomycetes bacterium GWF2_41_51]HBG28759.1 hypothetical protein [Phycisphaerales bacterium]
MNGTDNQILQARSSAAMFETCVMKYMKDSYRIALGFCGNHQDALELSQEAFLKAYRSIRHLQNNDKFFPWFYQILRNLCFDYMRKKKTQAAQPLDEITSEKLMQNNFDPEAIAERNETKEIIWKAIGQLDEKHREIIILRHFLNQSYEQIAKNLFCSKGTVMSRLYYGRRQLKEILSTMKGGH